MTFKSLQLRQFGLEKSNVRKGIFQFLAVFGWNKVKYARITITYGPRRKKTCLRGFAKNTGADQPAHPRSLISPFVILFLESIICKLATGEISIF